MHWSGFFIYAFLAAAAAVAAADVLVQLNINRPINDVSSKFVSFSMKPEDLYRALDGPKRKTITRMASMLGNAHIKFIGDFNFAEETETSLRNPTKTVWKGFNKWSTAVNWSMIIPVPYSPNNWDPMHALKILNTSQLVGITNCIWQLGTDFGSSRAADYVRELETFSLMVGSFKRQVEKWQIMGADISGGSSPEETRRYVDMSRTLNTAYGWIDQSSSDLIYSNSLTSSINNNDPALRVLFSEQVPVWLSLPRKKFSSSYHHSEDELMDGLKWAQTMGDAANIGFDAIFKHISPSDFEHLQYTFYVTALFKKVMGSRVFPARPLTVFGRSNNKLYTHCANAVSGGLAFMVINHNERPLQIAVRSMSKVKDNELWQYTLSMTNGHVLLNNRKINVNSSLTAEVKRRQSQSMLQLKTPGMSVSFYVLPRANVEHCHFTEVEPVDMDIFDEGTEKRKRYSATDRLLKELLKETAKSQQSVVERVPQRPRHRRSIAGSQPNERPKRFVLEPAEGDFKPFKGFNLVGDHQSLKREIFSPERGQAAMKWLGNIFSEPFNLALPSLKRSARNSESYTGPYFITRDGKRTTFTKKITEIKRPEKKQKPRHDIEEFNEETFFKNVGFTPEPDYVKVPEGDVFIKHISSLDGDEVDDELKIEKNLKAPQKQSKSMVAQPKEIVNEMKPLRLLPTEFYEALPLNPMGNSKLNLGSSLNSLLSNSFGKRFGKGEMGLFGKPYMLKANGDIGGNSDNESDLNSSGSSRNDFEKAQLDMENSNAKKKESNEMKLELDDSHENIDKNIHDLLNDSEVRGKASSAAAAKKSNDKFFNNFSKAVKEEDNKSSLLEAKPKFDELPWWDLTPLRLKRSLDSNQIVIHDAENPVAAANQMSARRMRTFEYKVDDALNSAKRTRSTSDNDDNFGKRIVNTFKEHVVKLVDMVSHQVHDWYEAIAKQIEERSHESNSI